MTESRRAIGFVLDQLGCRLRKFATHLLDRLPRAYEVHALAHLIDQVIISLQLHPNLPDHVVGVARLFEAAVPALDPLALALRQLTVVSDPIALDDAAFERRRILLIMSGIRP